MECSRCRTYRNMGSPLYLRDLKDNLQREFLDIWKTRGRDDLVKAHEDGDDITVGYYVKDGEEAV